MKWLLLLIVLWIIGWLVRRLIQAFRIGKIELNGRIWDKESEFGGFYVAVMASHIFFLVSAFGIGAFTKAPSAID